MNVKKANWMFLLIIISHAALSLLASSIPILTTLLSNIMLNVLISEVTIWLPALLFLVTAKTRPAAFCRLKRVHVSTALMTVLYTMLLEPLEIVVNAFSMLFTDNTVAGMGEQIVAMPFWAMLLGVAVYGPFSEELAFRGVLYQSYRKQGNGWKAMLLSSLLFGLMHMNLNQACYAFVMGMALALLVEASDSMIPAFIAHFSVNGLSTVMMFAMDKMSASGVGELMTEAQSSLDTQELLICICLYVLIATICTPLAGCVLVWIAGREGHSEDLRNLWNSRKVKSGKLLSVPLILGILICVAMIVLQIILQ